MIYQILSRYIKDATNEIHICILVLVTGMCLRPQKFTNMEILLIVKGSPPILYLIF